MNIHKSITFNSLFFRKDSAGPGSSAGAEKNRITQGDKTSQGGYNRGDPAAIDSSRAHLPALVLQLAYNIICCRSQLHGEFKEFG